MALSRTLRKKPDLDMNPMVDMAFLLVSFFMMTTTFKAGLPEEVQIPASISEAKLPETAICTITISKSGKVYVGIDNKNQRKEWLRRVSAQMDYRATEIDWAAFCLIPAFGVPKRELPGFLAAHAAGEPFEQGGIPVAEGEDELSEWLLTARLINPRLRFAVYADRDTRYPDVARVFEILRELNITRFSLVTDSKSKDAALLR
jgi:biopolymer transport protein ExbD